MQTLTVRNVNQALPELMRLFLTTGQPQESRNGDVLKIPGPVSICYEKPLERVMFWPERNANPFFHCLEALWMLAGRNDVDFVSGIVPRMATYSDDGSTFNAAYGFRWRRHFGHDQLESIAQVLRANPQDRRQVLAMWDGLQDLGSKSLDLPCNTQVYFSRADSGALDMMVTNRSNDVVWGALGANAVHFSVLQEYMAAMIGCEVGKYWQVSFNLHLYLEPHKGLMKRMVDKAWPSRQYLNQCPYELGQVETTPLLKSRAVDKFDADVAMLLDEGPCLGMTDWFVRKVAGPLLEAIRVYKDDGEFTRNVRVQTAQNIVQNRMPHNSDWRLAAWEWLERRRQSD